MMNAVITPLHVFRFHVSFGTDDVSAPPSHNQAQVCSGAFAECSGLEATMEPKAIREGGRNYGVAQRAGQTTFPTVVLKRGISLDGDLFELFNTVAIGRFAKRMQVTIHVFDNDGTPTMAWQLNQAMPIKYKFSDLNARNSEIGVEELHLVHEGLWAVDTIPGKLSDLTNLTGLPFLTDLFEN